MDGVVPQPSTLSRFRGCLLGLAIGDALGMPVEGARASSIRSRLGEVRDFLPAPWRRLRAGQWTDGTKMALCLARSIAETGTVDLGDIAGRLLQWMDSGDWRGMSDAAYSSLKRLREGVPPERSGEEGEKAQDSGCILRTVPVALLRCRDMEALRRDVQAACFITHRNPEALAGSLAAAFAVSRAALGELEPSTLLEDASSFAGSATLGERLSLAGKLLKTGAEAAEALLRLGISGSAAETVSASLFCFLSHPHDFEEALVAAVSGGSHADETAALAGAVSGAFLGEEAIPQRWLSGVEGAEEMAELAERLHSLAFGCG